jgi:hypothetical protein
MLAPPAVEALLELRSMLTASRERGVRLPLYRAVSRAADAQRFALAAPSPSPLAGWRGASGLIRATCNGGCTGPRSRCHTEANPLRFKA